MGAVGQRSQTAWGPTGFAWATLMADANSIITVMVRGMGLTVYRLLHTARRRLVAAGRSKTYSRRGFEAGPASVAPDGYSPQVPAPAFGLGVLRANGFTLRALGPIGHRSTKDIGTARELSHAPIAQAGLPRSTVILPEIIRPMQSLGRRPRRSHPLPQTRPSRDARGIGPCQPWRG